VPEIEFAARAIEEFQVVKRPVRAGLHRLRRHWQGAYSGSFGAIEQFSKARFA